MKITIHISLTTAFIINLALGLLVSAWAVVALTIAVPHPWSQIVASLGFAALVAGLALVGNAFFMAFLAGAERKAQGEAKSADVAG